MVESRVCCFGEILLRLSPELQGKWIRQASMPVYVGGAELNVAQALNVWGVPARYITALPDHYLADEMLGFLANRGIDTSAVLRSGDRIGTYYLPTGADMKHARVIYDRAGSSFSALQAGAINWEAALDAVSWFHFSAISPAVSQGAADACLEAVQACRRKGIPVSLDLNHRSKLWKYGQTPVNIMRPLVDHCQWLMGNIWSASALLGLPVDENIHDRGDRQSYLDHARQTSLAIFENWPSVRALANTFRFDRGDRILYYATLDTPEQQVVSREWTITEVADRVGSGDCFMAGLIRGWLLEQENEDIINFAAAAAMVKLGEKGDATQSPVERIQNAILPVWPKPRI